MVALALYGLAGQTQVGWLYFVASLALGVLLWSAIFPWASLRGLVLESRSLVPLGGQRPKGPPTHPNDVFVGDHVAIRLQLRNTGSLGVFFVRVVETCPFADPRECLRAFLIPSIAPGGTHELAYEVPCLRRGRHIFPPVRAETAAPFGLFRSRRAFALPTPLMVYPEYFMMSALPSQKERESVTTPQPRAGEGTDFYGARLYRPGDPLRRIHWRATARLDRLVVKEFERPAQSSLSIAFEAAMEWGEGLETTLEYSVKIAASVAAYAIQQGRGVRFLLPNVPQRDLSWREVLERLATIQAGDAPPLATSLTRPSSAEDIVVILPHLKNAAVVVCQQLHERVNSLHVVLLRGFAQDFAGEATTAPLGVPILVCAKGENIGEALARGWASEGSGALARGLVEA